jgi:hypothetical protein
LINSIFGLITGYIVAYALIFAAKKDRPIALRFIIASYISIGRKFLSVLFLCLMDIYHYPSVQEGKLIAEPHVNLEETLANLKYVYLVLVIFCFICCISIMFISTLLKFQFLDQKRILQIAGNKNSKLYIYLTKISK